MAKLITLDNLEEYNNKLLGIIKDDEEVFAAGLNDLHDTKQDILTAGSNITISGSTISAKDTTYTAGDGITISNGTISASAFPYVSYSADNDYESFYIDPFKFYDITIDSCGWEININLNGCTDTSDESWTNTNIYIMRFSDSTEYSPTISFTGGITFIGDTSALSNPSCKCFEVVILAGYGLVKIFETI